MAAGGQDPAQGQVDDGAKLAVDEIRAYSADLSDVARFLSYLPAGWSFPTLYSATYFDWKIARNPFGHSASFLRTRNGEAAAHLCVTSKPGNPKLVGAARIGELCDAYTNPGFQRQGHFIALSDHVIRYFEQAEASDSLIFAGGPNAYSLPGFLKCGCLSLDSIALRHVRQSPWRRARHWLSDRLARAHDRVQLEPAIDVEASMKRIDAVWEEASSTGWMVGKTGAWWRYRYVESTERFTSYFIRVDGEIRGWAVVKRLASKWPGVSRTAICDIVATSAEVEVAGFDAIMREVVGPLDVVVTWTQRGTPLGDATDRLGFSLVRDVPIVFADTNALRSLMKSTKVPRMSLGDTDNV